MGGVMRRPNLDNAVYFDQAMPVRVLVDRETFDGIALVENDGKVFVRWMDPWPQLAWLPAGKVRRLLPQAA